MTEIRKCSNCFKLKPAEDFYIKRERRKSKVYVTRQARCKECNAEVARGWRERKRLEMIDRYVGI